MTIAWGELQAYDHPDGPILGREFELLATGSMFGGVLGGVIGLPGRFAEDGTMRVEADGQPLIYSSGRCPLEALRPHQQTILVEFMDQAPWGVPAEG